MQQSTGNLPLRTKGPLAAERDAGCGVAIEVWVIRRAFAGAPAFRATSEAPGGLSRAELVASEPGGDSGASVLEPQVSGPAVCFSYPHVKFAGSPSVRDYTCFSGPRWYQSANLDVRARAVLASGGV